MKTDEELKQIALDLSDGRIFSDRQVDDVKCLGMIFMPIMFGAFHGRGDKAFFLYEYMSAAFPMCINGMPMFPSVRYLDKEETERMFFFYKEIEDFKNKYSKSEKDQARREVITDK